MNERPVKTPSRSTRRRGADEGFDGQHAHHQDGYALIEVIVSAAVLAIVALAVLSGIDGATASTARERARAIAGSLAEKDQERLRS